MEGSQTFFQGGPDDFVVAGLLMVYRGDLEFRFLLSDPGQGLELIVEEVALTCFTLPDIPKTLISATKKDRRIVQLGI